MEAAALEVDLEVGGAKAALALAKDLEAGGADHLSSETKQTQMQQSIHCQLDGPRKPAADARRRLPEQCSSLSQMPQPRARAARTAQLSVTSAAEEHTSLCALVEQKQSPGRTLVVLWANSENQLPLANPLPLVNVTLKSSANYARMLTLKSILHNCPTVKRCAPLRAPNIWFRT